MEQTLPSKKDIQSLEITTVNNIAKAVLHFNQLTPFPYSDIQIMDWAKSINELTPELTPDIVKKIIDKYKLGIYEFDTKLGIQNIFNGYRLILEEKIQFINNGGSGDASLYRKIKARISPKRIVEDGLL